MSETNAQEPTMEEILASIRRIISEDEAPPAAEPAGPASAAPPEPAQAPTLDHEDVLELTERVEPPPKAPEPKAPEPPPPAPAPPPVAAPAPAPEPTSLGDIDFSSPATPPSPPAQTPPASASPPPGDEEGLIAPFAASEAAVHFGQLAQSLAMPAGGRTLEDVVRELLRPLLKDWLEQHLARIVETRVQAEVERISRSRGF